MRPFFPVRQEPLSVRAHSFSLLPNHLHWLNHSLYRLFAWRVFERAVKTQIHMLKIARAFGANTTGSIAKLLNRPVGGDSVLAQGASSMVSLINFV